MKKSIIIAIILTIACVTAYAQEKQTESKVKHLTYSGFLKKVWNFESNPTTFIYKGDVPAVIDFYADWCGPCRRVAPIMEQMAEDYEGKLLVYKVNVSEEKDLAAVFQVRSIPMVLFIPVKGMPYKQVGALPEQNYREVVEEQLLK